MFGRMAGVLLHPTSLPGGHGVGDLGEGAFRFIDLLARAGFGIWQVLPLGPTGGTNSPYQSPSSFAGNPLLISLDSLAREGWIPPGELAGAPANDSRVDYAASRRFKESVLRRIHRCFAVNGESTALSLEYQAFQESQRGWLEDYALYCVAAEMEGALGGMELSEDRAPADSAESDHRPPLAAAASASGAPPAGSAWWQWEDQALACREPRAMAAWRAAFPREIDYHKFTQFIFHRQWKSLRAHAAGRGVRIVGDVPIYCAMDSADVWSSREWFALDAEGRPEAVAGVPPDYFSATGQLWGNPLYRWDRLREDGFRWWLSRLGAALSLADGLRIDHFRGLESYWAVPAGEETAINGQWLPGPGQDFLDAALREFGHLPIIAEDLGIITPEVDALRRANRLPGMKVLQFAFADGAGAYLPHAYDTACVCYTATHDNDTTRGWYEAAGPDYHGHDPEATARERDRARRYLGRDGHAIAWDFMRLAFSSVAETAIAPMQDWLGLPNGARMNRPGVGDGQWEWRLTDDQLREAPVDALRDMLVMYERVAKVPDPAKAAEGRPPRAAGDAAAACAATGNAEGR